jgi:hypothetical protein
MMEMLKDLLPLIIVIMTLLLGTIYCFDTFSMLKKPNKLCHSFNVSNDIVVQIFLKKGKILVSNLGIMKSYFKKIFFFWE